ncbi:Formation of crista junctions protein 1 [Nowakowskiella sp. JEL0078]|nr:Formation of crista junctions protein 1 [Nowakowskiella sp. JEL0078]
MQRRYIPKKQIHRRFASSSAGSWSNRKILFTATFVAASVYVGGAVIASQSTQFRKVWVDNVPGGEISAVHAKAIIKRAKTLKVEDVTKAADDAKNKVLKTATEIQETSTKTYEFVNSSITKISESVTENVGKAQKTYNEAKEGAQKAYDNVQTAVQNTTDYVQDISKDIQYQFESAKSSITGQPAPKKPEKTADRISKSSGKTTSVETPGTKQEISATAISSKKDNPIISTSAEKKQPDPKLSEKDIPKPAEPNIEINADNPNKSQITPLELKEESSIEQKIEVNSTSPEINSEPEKKESSKEKYETQEVEISKLIEEISVPTAILQPAPKKPAAVLIAEEIVELQKAIKSLPDELTARKIARAMNALAETVSELSLPIDKADRMKRDLENISFFVGHLEKDEFEHIQKVLSEQSKKYSNFVVSFEDEKRLALERQASELALQSKDELEKNKKELIELYDTQLADAIAKQTVEMRTQLEEILTAEMEEMKKYWTNEVKFRIDNERAGRLARLDKLTLKLKYLETVSIEAGEELEKSTRVHKLWTALRGVQYALSDPYQKLLVKSLEILRELAEDDPVIQTVFEKFTPEALQLGIPTESDLSEKFVQIRPFIRRAQLMPADGGSLAYVASTVLSTVMLSKHGLINGDDVESILSRTQFYLNAGNMDMATRELNQLKGWPRKLAQDWLLDARKHLEFKQALQVCYFSLFVQYYATDI